MAAHKIERMRKAIVVIGYFISVSAVTYFSTKLDGLWITIIIALVACGGFWFVPEILFKKWINSGWDKKFDQEIKVLKIEDHESRFEINRDSCKVFKK
jgi:hypothetical protein